MLRIYVASKLIHAARWRALCDTTPHVQFHARWLKHNKIGTEDSSKNATEFWREDEKDIQDADLVIVYGELGEHLRGALVEAGMAIAYGVPVFVIGSHPDYGTWQFHPGVKHHDTLDGALKYLAKHELEYKRGAKP